MTQASPPQKKKSAFPIVLVVIAIAAPIVIALAGVMTTLAIYGVSRYLKQAKMAEARAATSHLARGIVACAEASGALPRSSAPVPPDVPSAAKYQSATADWADPAFSCARFSIATPQYFRYQWVATSATSGTARAEGDFSGAGKTTSTVEVDVECTRGATLACTLGTPRETM